MSSNLKVIPNNNPGNIIFVNSIKWQGQTGKQGRFSVFTSIETGTRAMILNLWAYWYRYRDRSPRTMILRWDSDPNEYPIYLKNVVAWTGFTFNKAMPWNKATVKSLVTSMARMENGVAARDLVAAGFEVAWNSLPSEVKKSYTAYEVW